MYRGPIIRENAYSYMYLCTVSSEGSISSMNMGTQHAQRVVVKRNICTEDTKDLCLCRSRVNGEVDMARMMVQASLIFLTDFLSLRCIFVILSLQKKTQSRYIKSCSVACTNMHNSFSKRLFRSGSQSALVMWCLRQLACNACSSTRTYGCS